MGAPSSSRSTATALTPPIWRPRCSRNTASPTLATPARVLCTDRSASGGAPWSSRRCAHDGASGGRLPGCGPAVSRRQPRAAGGVAALAACAAVASRGAGMGAVRRRSLAGATRPDLRLQQHTRRVHLVGRRRRRRRYRSARVFGPRRHRAQRLVRGNVLIDGGHDGRAGPVVSAAFDWDSLAARPEAVIAGLSAGSHTMGGAAGDAAPTPAQASAFLADYELARREPFPAAELRSCCRCSLLDAELQRPLRGLLPRGGCGPRARQRTARPHAASRHVPPTAVVT